ncbi:MAG: pyridoxal phosphate-dependent aminotransferase [Spirochaetaceae bacterium]|nr:pyridoxal phosphate-dependent aminotransferase [Spirochaetaceae bacterium]
MDLSNLAQNSTGSMIRKMFNEALKIQDTISFSVGEPDFITPQPIIDAACEAWQRGLTHYTPNKGIPELCAAIARYHSSSLKPDPEKEIVITCGGTEAIQLALFTLVNHGDEVILPTPAWPNYFGQLAMCGAIVKQIPSLMKNNFVPDPDDIKKALSSKTKLVILNFPSNPTGATLDKETAQRIADVLRNTNAYIISDEVYSRIVFDNKPHISILDFEDLRERTVYINSFSKMFAMTGWRLGYAVADEAIITGMTKLHENGASCLPAPSQLGAVAGLNSCDADIEKMRVIFQKRRNIFCEGINSIPRLSCNIPGGAFYVFVNITETGVNSETFCMRLLHKTGVVAVPGVGFGDAGETFVRFTVATSEKNIHEGLNRLRDFCLSGDFAQP